MKKIIFILFLLVTLFTLSCEEEADSNDIPENVEELLANKWNLDQILSTGEFTYLIISGAFEIGTESSTVTLDFRPDSNTVISEGEITLTTTFTALGESTSDTLSPRTFSESEIFWSLDDAEDNTLILSSKIGETTKVEKYLITSLTESKLVLKAIESSSSFIEIPSGYDVTIDELSIILSR